MQQKRKGSGFKTEWTVAGDATARTITLPLANSGIFNCTVDWGDGSEKSIITAYNDADRIHTYASDGTYDVEITGDCPSWRFNNAGDKLKITDIISWGSNGSNGFSGFEYLSDGFRGCTNLKSLGTGKIVSKNLSNVYGLFWGCNNVNLTAIPSGLFDLCTSLTANAFSGTFRDCTRLTSIPTDIFRYNTLAINFGGTFLGCTGLTSIPTDIFRYNTLALDLNSAFYGCTGLTSIPTDIFRYNTLVTNFNSVFFGCTGLTSIPTDIFRYNTLATNFGSVFYNDYKITTVPQGLFKYNTANNISFYAALGKLNKMQCNQWIFYDDGEQSTRFLNKTVDFRYCFECYSFTGTQGVAPDLWNCDFGTGSATKATCFGGGGNTASRFTNYGDIPTEWK